MNKTIILLMMILSSSAANGARILALFGMASQSHNIVFTALTKELAIRGHDLTVITSFPIMDPPQNYRQIETSGMRKMFTEHTHLLSQINYYQLLKTILTSIATACSKILQTSEVKALLNEEFDLILIATKNDCCLPFVHHFNTPFIVLSPSGLVSTTSIAVGNPVSAAFIPNSYLPFTDHMNFWQRSVNFMFGVIMQIFQDFIIKPDMNVVARKFFGDDIPSIEELEVNASLVLINHHVSLNYPRPLNPNVIEVGGMQIKQNPDQLPKDIQEFLDDANDGAIYFSMGSALPLDQLPPEKKQQILQTFAKLKQRVLWKWESDILPGQPPNVKLNKWLPQQSVLAHPNVRLFITHGGMLSIQESLYHGVPLVGIPVFSDQELNMKRSQDLGIALTVDYNTISNATLFSAIQSVLNDPSFTNKAQTVMRRMRDQPETPLERAVYWTEYVLRHNGAHHLRSAATQLSWYQLHMIDFTAFVILIILLSVLVIKTCIRLWTRLKANISASMKKIKDDSVKAKRIKIKKK